jgi:large subunit ribosomal protein L7/L12
MATLTNEKILEAIKEKSVRDLNELVKMIQEEFDVTPMAMAAPVAAAAPGAGVAAEDEQTQFDVVLTGFGEKKIQVIKAVRELTSLGLKEAKELVEGVPKTVIEAASKEDAEAGKKRLEDAGGTADVK